MRNVPRSRVLGTIAQQFSANRRAGLDRGRNNGRVLHRWHFPQLKSIGGALDFIKFTAFFNSPDTRDDYSSSAAFCNSTVRSRS